MKRAYILIIVIISIVAVLIGFKFVLPLFLPFLFGYFLAWIAAPMVHFLRVRCKIPRGIGSILVVTTFLFVLIIVLYFLLRAAFQQLQAFTANLPQYQNMLFQSIQRICGTSDKILGLVKGSSYEIVSGRLVAVFQFVQERGISRLSGQALDIARVIFQVIWNCIMIFLSSLLWVKDFPEYKEEFENSCFYKEIHMVTSVLSDMGIAYLKAQFILMCITAVILMIGLFLIGNHYAILVGVGIAIFDAFPVLGIAFILIPWALILFIKRNIYSAVVILVTFAICQLVRQFLEPKLVGDRIGVRPIYTLIAMYIGLKIYGVFGFILGPISLVAIQAIVKAGMTKLRGTQESYDKKD